jgi:hypothetical protein
MAIRFIGGSDQKHVPTSGPAWRSWRFICRCSFFVPGSSFFPLGALGVIGGSFHSRLAIANCLFRGCLRGVPIHPLLLAFLAVQLSGPAPSHLCNLRNLWISPPAPFRAFVFSWLTLSVRSSRRFALRLPPFAISPFHFATWRRRGRGSTSSFPLSPYHFRGPPAGRRLSQPSVSFVPFIPVAPFIIPRTAPQRKARQTSRSRPPDGRAANSIPGT